MCTPRFCQVSAAVVFTSRRYSRSEHGSSWVDSQGLHALGLKQVLEQRSVRVPHIPNPHLTVHAGSSVPQRRLGHEVDPPSCDQLPLAGSLEVDRLDPRMVLPPHSDDHALRVRSTLVEQTDHAVAKAGNKEVTVGLVGCDCRQVRACLRGDVLRVISQDVAETETWGPDSPEDAARRARPRA